MLETLESQPLHSDHDSDETDVEGYQESNSQDKSNFSGDFSDNQSGSSSTASVSDTPPPRKGSNTSMKEDSNEVPVTDKVGIKGKKRKRSKGEILEDVMTKVVKTMSDGRSSDKMFMELEEKRLQFEEKQKREEHEFQLKMVQMLQGGMEGSSMYPPQYHAPPPSSLYYNPPGSTTSFEVSCRTIYIQLIIEVVHGCM